MLAVATVSFPRGRQQAESPVFARNELFIAAPPERVWPWLIRPARWPEFYGNARDIDRPDGEAAVLAKIAAMPAPYRAMGERLHALILRSAPALRPTLHYGMPWYAKEGKRVCFFRADKLMTFGLTEEANLTREEGAAHQLLSCAWYFAALDDATEARLGAIVRNAAS